MSYNEKTGVYTRHCKQCGDEMKEPLKVEDKLYMFCSAACRTIWDRERAYKTALIEGRTADANLN